MLGSPACVFCSLLTTWLSAARRFTLQSSDTQLVSHHISLLSDYPIAYINMSTAMVSSNTSHVWTPPVRALSVHPLGQVPSSFSQFSASTPDLPHTSNCRSQHSVRDNKKLLKLDPRHVSVAPIVF